MRQLTKYSFIFLLLLLGLAWSAVQSLPDRKLHIDFYDVGQGDGMLITTPTGKRIVIDGGPGKKFLNYLGSDMPFFSKTIDLMILTHPHEDHLGGLVEVIDRYDVAQVWMEPVVHTTDSYMEWLKKLQSRKVKVGDPEPGDSIDLGDGVVLKVLWPPQDVVDNFKDLNATSIVVLVEYGDFSALLTGDAGEESQPYGLTSILPAGASIDVLKVPHHGSRTGLGEAFLELIRPKEAVISAGAKNRFGHPAPEILAKLEAQNVKIYRTDKVVLSRL